LYRRGSQVCIFGTVRRKFRAIAAPFQLGSFVNFVTNDILYDYQFGFRRHHPTCLALIDVGDQIYQHLHNHEFVLRIYIDLQKAFDTVDNILLKLFNYGIIGNIHSGFCDYLSDRKQYVCISGINSDLGKN